MFLSHHCSYDTWQRLKKALTFYSKGEKVVAKSHGGPIEIFGLTVAQVDDKVRLQGVDTWFDPLDMFRQIAPNGIVDKQTMNHKVNLETALDVDGDYEPAATTQPVAQPTVPSCDGIQVTQDVNTPGSHDIPAPEEFTPKHLSTVASEPADAVVPHQGPGIQQPETMNLTEQSAAQCPVDTAATQDTHTDVEKTEGDSQESHADSSSTPVGSTPSMATDTMDVNADGARPVDVEPTDSIYSSTVCGQADGGLRAEPSDNSVYEQKLQGTHDVADKHLEGPTEQVHPHPHEMEDVVKPGEAVAAPAGTEETRPTHEEMSRIASDGCPFPHESNMRGEHSMTDLSDQTCDE